MKIHVLTLAFIWPAALCRASDPSLDCSGIKAISPRCASNETPYQRDFFYVGGRYIQTTLGNVTVDQVYVEKLSPVADALQPHPLVFFHGGGTSGVTWLNTPDNREGWATYFVKKGYHVYLVDAYSGARSPANNFDLFEMLAGQPVELVERFFTSPSDKHTQWPGSGLNNGDPTFDAFKKALIPWTRSFVLQELVMRAAGCELLTLLGSPAYLISHSLGSFYPILLSNDCPHLIKGSINLEPATTPFWRYNVAQLGGVPQSPWGLTFSPLSYDPPVKNASGPLHAALCFAERSEFLLQFINSRKSHSTNTERKELVIESVGEDTLESRNCYQQVEPARQLPNISSVPYLGLSGEAGTHITFGHCIINYLKQVGGSPEYVKLADVGIKGNGHFMHLELNNLEIARLVEEWIVDRERKFR